MAGRLRRPHVRAHGDVHADEAGGGRERSPDEEADRGSPAELVVEAEQEERRDRDEADRHVLAPEVGSRAFLHRLADLAHALVAGRPAEHPDRQPDSEPDRHARAEERKQHGVVVEKPAQSASLTKSAPGCPGAAQFLSNERRARRPGHQRRVAVFLQVPTVAPFLRSFLATAFVTCTVRERKQSVTFVAGARPLLTTRSTVAPLAK